MNFIKKLPPYLLILALLGITAWSIFYPKEDFVNKISQTLSKQKNRADLFFSKVTVAEILDGIKFWELNAQTSSLNKTTNVTSLGEVKGTFFEGGNPALKILAPNAVWNMGGKEIFLKEPIGYDMKFERNFGSKLKDLKNIKDPRALFNLPASGSPAESGYWFKAHNLNWGLATKRMICSDGIMLTKGNLMIESKKLEADVAMEHVTLMGSPKAVFDSTTLEAATIEVDSLTDFVYAKGNVILTRPDARITADNSLYKQRTNEVEFTGNVRIAYKDLKAWGKTAKYDIDGEIATLIGEAGALRGDNALAGREIRIFFKEDRVTVKGGTRIKINREELK